MHESLLLMDFIIFIIFLNDPICLIIKSKFVIDYNYPSNKIIILQIK